jgi:hypothetical protein
MLLLLSRQARERLFPSPLLLQMGWLAIALVPMAFIFSAASGRMTLYLFPVSMYVLAALPIQFARSELRAAIRTSLAATMMATLWVWLAFANSSLAHIPYGNALLTNSWELQLCCE